MRHYKLSDFSMQRSKKKLLYGASNFSVNCFEFVVDAFLGFVFDYDANDAL
jgi:hypothetical protein